MTYVVVKNDKDSAAQDRMVPVASIGQTNPSLIRLNCTLAELAQLPSFSSTHSFSYTYDDYSISAATLTGPYLAPAKTTTYAERVVEAIPSGQRVLRRGVKVEATDGVVGQVGDLLLDPESGEITHFTRQDGHVWGKQEITLPVSAIQFAGEEGVYLKLNRRAIESLPAVPIKRRFAKGDQPGGIELIARVFDTPQRAGEALEFVKGLQRRQRGTLKILNSDVLVKDDSGNVTITETGDLSPRKGTVLGVVAGGLLGALAETRAICDEPGAMQQEGTYLTALRNILTYTLADGRLVDYYFDSEGAMTPVVDFSEAETLGRLFHCDQPGWTSAARLFTVDGELGARPCVAAPVQ